MSFWGCQLKPGQSHKAALPDDDFLHLSQICLHEPKAGKNYVQVKVGDRLLNLVCLEKDKLEHQAVDLIFGPEAPVFSNKGSSEVHITGYIEPNDEAGSAEEAAASAASEAAVRASPKLAARASPKAAAQASPKAAAKASPKAAAAPAKAAEESEDDAEEGEEEEPMEGDEESEGEESEEEAAPPAKKQKVAAGKAAASPKAGAKAAASPKAGAKAAAAPKAGGGDAAAGYVRQLQDLLKTSGSLKLGELGSKVKRPEGVPKLKAVLEANKDKFVVSGESVSLKK